MARWRKIVTNLDQIHGDLARISTGYLSNTSRGAQIPRHQVSWETKLCAPNICGYSVWNLLYVTLLALRIFGWLLGFWKICEPLVWCIPVTLTCIMGRH